MSMHPHGTRFDGRYDVLDVLGEGGFATVYRVQHSVLDSVHALKVLLPQYAGDAEVRARFLSEGKIQARLMHPHVIAVTDIVTDPAPGLVMTFVEGVTLTDYLANRGGPIPTNELVALFWPVLDAVGAAHRAGIVHRDLKPDNVIISTRGGVVWPMVGDFGIAKVVAGSGLGGGKMKTRTGISMGTLQYMSPEHIRGAANADARSDIFALGAILYECVTGRPAFEGDSDFDLQRNIVDGKFTAPERLVVGLPAELAACVKRALATEPGERYADCAGFGEGLRGGVAAAARARRDVERKAKQGGGKAVAESSAAAERGLPAEARAAVETRRPAAKNTAVVMPKEAAEPDQTQAKVPDTPRAPTAVPRPTTPPRAPGQRLVVSALLLSLVGSGVVVAGSGYWPTALPTDVPDSVVPLSAALPPPNIEAEFRPSPSPVDERLPPRPRKQASGVEVEGRKSAPAVKQQQVGVEASGSPVAVRVHDADVGNVAVLHEIKTMAKSVMAANTWQIEACAQNRLAVNPDFTGSWRVQFTISTEGGVKAPSITAQDAPDGEMESCLLRVVSAWRFGRADHEFTVAKTYWFSSSI